MLFEALAPVLDSPAEKQLDAACAATGARISRVFSSPVSEMHTTRKTVSDASSAMGDTPPARLTHRGLLQISTREPAFAPVMTIEQLIESLDDLDAEPSQAAGRYTPQTSHNHNSPWPSIPHFQPLLSNHEPPPDE